MAHASANAAKESPFRQKWVTTSWAVLLAVAMVLSTSVVAVGATRIGSSTIEGNTSGATALGGGSATCPSTVSGTPSAAVPDTTPNLAAIPGAVQTLQSIGALSTTVYLGLALQNTSQLNLLLAEVANPGSPLYRHYISHDAFEQDFEPSLAVDRAIGEYYNATYGLSVLASPDHLTLPLRGTLAQLSTAFGTSFAQYTIPMVESWGTYTLPYYFNTGPIQVPTALASCVTGELGFTNYTGIQPALRINPADGALTPSQAVNVTLTNNGLGLAEPQPPYTPGTLQFAYNESGFLNSGYQGQYITVAVNDAYGDPTAHTDMASIDAQYNLATPASFNVLSPYAGTEQTTLGGITGISSLWEVETALDFEMAHTFAPQANIISLVSPDAGYTLEETVVYAIVTDLANVVSNSWGSPEPEVGPAANYMHPFFEMAAAEGITVLAATGDQGAAGYDSAVPDSVMWPSDDPFVLAVGGTTLAMNGTVSTVQNPTNGPPAVTEVYNPTARLWEDAWDGYTGGGYSTIYSRPAWQTGAGVPETGAFAGVRGVPDVSANAMFGGNDMVVNGVVNGGLAFGGTSFASPMWAGMIAAIDSYAASIRGDFLGYLTPTLYDILDSPVYGHTFFDITNGSNGANGVYDCTPGWDPVTGMGSPNVGYLSSVLAQESYYAGAVGDAGSANNTGVSAQIETVLPQTTYGQGANYAYVQETLPDGSFLWTGYTVSMADPSGAWFFAEFPAAGANYGTSGVTTGPNGGVGADGALNDFSIVASPSGLWSFEMNGQVLGESSSASNSTGRNSPLVGVAALGTGTDSIGLGPIHFAQIAYSGTAGWQPWPAATGVVATRPFSTGTPAYTIPNPLGVASASPATLLAGSGEPNANGETLWGTPQQLPPITVLRNSPAVVSLYAQDVATIGTASQHFPLATTYPSGQGNFGSFYIVPVLGVNSWSFTTNQSFGRPLTIAQGTPLVGHFFLSLGTSVGVSSPGVVPVTVVISVTGGGAVLGTGVETENLSVTGVPVEYNVSVSSAVSAIPEGGSISMVVTWYEVSTQGESVAWPISIDSGAQYPISLDLPTLNPVDVSPLSVAGSGTGVTVSTDVIDPIGAYDLRSVGATLNGGPIGDAVRSGTTYAWEIPLSALANGKNEVSVTGTDLQNWTNTAAATFQENFYSVSFQEAGLPAGTGWSVALNGNTLTGTATTLPSIDLPNGTYTFLVTSSNPTYRPLPTLGSLAATGTVLVNGTATTITVPFVEVVSEVLFTEEGLPAGTNWSVGLGSSQESSTTSEIGFNVPNGTYSYSVAPVPGYETTYSGLITVDGANVSQAVSFVPTTFTVTFQESGLRSGAGWSITLAGVTQNSSTSTISFIEANGTYPYVVTPIPGYETAYSGQTTVNGGPTTVTVAFALVVYEVTFAEKGLKKGQSWSVICNGVEESSTGPSITFSEPNGSFSYTVSGPAGMQASPSSGTVIVNGNSVEVTIAFTHAPPTAPSPSSSYRPEGLGVHSPSGVRTVRL